MGFVIADLLSKGIQVALPISEHLPFDLIAMNTDGQLKKVSVKYRECKKGILNIKFRSCYSDKNGVHTKKLDKKHVDVFAVYCPDTNSVYYFNHNDFKDSVNLRVGAPKNGAKKNIHFVDDFKEYR